MIKPIVVIALTVIALIFFLRTLYILFSLLKKAKPPLGKPPIAAGIKDLLVMVLGQKKVLRWLYSGILHVFIFWGFLVLLTTVIEMYGEAFDPAFVVPIIGGNKFMAFCQDLFTVLVLVGVVMAFVFRVFVRPKRYQGSDNIDALVILALITTIMVTILFMHAMRVADNMEYAQGFFVSKHIAAAIPREKLHPIAEVSYWIHLVVILFFLNWIPRGKHLHLLTIVPNIILRRRHALGKLSKLDLDDEEAESFGANSWPEFTQKQMLDTYACMECGRCVAVCPANSTGKELNPKKLHTGIRYAAQNKAKALLSGKEEFSSVVDETFSENFFWQCTTCGACVEECPATNEHIDKIVDVRRYMVLTEGKMKPETAQAMKSIENQNNPFNMAHSTRFEWCEGLDLPSIKDKPDAEYIYWVGCFGCYDERNKKVTKEILHILQKTNVSFALLKGEEKCSGDPARRAGREDLFQMLAEENIETLNKYQGKKIITQCPHCFNTIKNEYPDFGGNYDVIHYSQFLAQLIQDKKLQMPAHLEHKRIAYHDSCYLGRHNSIYQEPRKVLNQVKGVDIVEMSRHHSNSFCCGAGGCRMFMEETEGKRVNVERVEEAARANADMVVSNCPFCLSMFEDGIKVAGLEEKFQAKDIAEIVSQTLENGQ